MKAVTDSEDLPSWVLSEKVVKKYYLAKCASTTRRTEQPFSEFFEYKKAYTEDLSLAYTSKQIPNK